MCHKKQFQNRQEELRENRQIVMPKKLQASLSDVGFFDTLVS